MAGTAVMRFVAADIPSKTPLAHLLPSRNLRYPKRVKNTPIMYQFVRTMKTKLGVATKYMMTLLLSDFDPRIFPI